MPATAELLDFARALADDARRIALQHFRQLRQVDAKHDRTPVTAADRGIERAWRERIAATFPEHGVLGEEEGQDRADAEFVWVLDPIDGTKAFATGNPLFGSLIGLCHRGRPLLGVMDAPALRERWWAAAGLGSWHTAGPLQVRRERPLADAVLYCTTPDALLLHPGHRRLRQAVQWTSYGADCLAYGFLAMGNADLVVDCNLKPYDWCALVPIVEAAGGVITDWRGEPLRLDSPGDVLVASGPTLAATARAALGEAAELGSNPAGA
jgi:inositol-phosphate phosphatase/L-galactose 1-phosphate phosphatase/histidinol-phosphatase